MNIAHCFRKITVFASATLSIFSLSVSTQAQQRACVLTDEGSTVCGKPTSITNDSRKTNQISLDNFLFALNGCRRSDTTVKCDLTLINKGLERGIRVYGQDSCCATSKIIDSFGKSHSASSVDMDGRISSFIITTVSPGVNYSAIVIFDNVPEQVSRIQLFSLELRIGDKYKSAKFRNFSIIS
jgi:hypothetical protein